MHVRPELALPSLRTERPMMRASGTFDVTLGSLPLHTTREATLGRMALDKVLHGALEATSHGEMLTATTEVPGSAGYVAIERVTGTLDGRTGSFTLQHLGVMTRGVGEMSITVVPDSGSGELAGLAGRLTIHIVDGKHSYDFDYTLPGA
jgi:hypothetical protein